MTETTCDPQSLKYLIYGPLQNKFANNPCLESAGITTRKPGPMNEKPE